MKRSTLAPCSLAILQGIAAACLLLPASVRAAEPATAEAAARVALDEQAEASQREAAVRDNVDQAAEVVAAMVRDLPADEAEEYRRIPWIWRMSIAAGRANDAEVLHKLLLVSMPADDQPLRDWQAVVLGGGVINGLTHAGVWPKRRVAELLRTKQQQSRWERSIELASKMADDTAVRSGTRYDALRMLGASSWEQYGTQLVGYLDPAEPELQMGAVSGLGDIDHPQAAEALVTSLSRLTEGNRALALEALLRSESRRQRLREAIAAGTAQNEWLSDEQRQQLQQ